MPFSPIAVECGVRKRDSGILKGMVLRVGVLRGGPSNEYEVSLKSGQAVLSALASFPDRFLGLDVLIDRSGAWHLNGRLLPADRILRQLDVAFLALHGAYGEDGHVQGLLDAFGVPYTGSGRLGSALAFHKGIARMVAQQAGIQVPKGWIVGPDADPRRVVAHALRSVAPPFVVKPVQSGSSVGVRKVWTADALKAAVQEAFSHATSVLIEEWIEGREATVGVLEQWGGKSLTALPEVEIVPPEGKDFFDYEAKYSGMTEERCPGRFSREVKDTLAQVALTIHRQLGLRHFSRTDCIVHPKRGVFFLEVNTLPGLTTASLFPQAAQAVGIPFPTLVSHLIRLAVEGDGKRRRSIAEVTVV